MKKAIIIIGIIMFSLSMKADNVQYNYSTQPQQRYENGYNPSYGRSQQSQGFSLNGETRNSWINNNTIYSGSFGSRMTNGGLFGSESNGGNRENGGNGDLVTTDNKTPLGDDAAILTVMVLLLGGFTYITRNR